MDCSLPGACLLGAATAFGVDIDALAVRTAIENGELNGLTAPRYTIRLGDLARDVTGKYPVIAANIVADAIIALSGLPKRDLMDKPNSEELERLMEQRQHYRFTSGDAPVRVTDGVEKYHLGVASPILCQGDLMGCVMLLLGEHDEPLQESDQKLAQIAANFLGSQMEN